VTLPIESHPRALSPRRLADRLATVERQRFVGRDAEVELFRSALSADEPPFAVLHVHGPGGVGKSALLRECARVAAGAGGATALVDAHDVEPSPPAFVEALAAALGASGDPSLTWLADQPPVVLLVDTYERLAPLDAWLRTTLLPQLPDRSLVVVAGRDPPSPAWTTDLGWGPLTRVVALRNLRPDESRAFLAGRGVPDERHESVLAFTHGHPLALALVADVLARSDGRTEFRPQDAPDIVRLLLEQFVASVPTPRHRLALEASAHTRVTTEPLIAAVVDGEDAHELFAWLRGLSFMEQGPDGLFPHDLAREVLDSDFRWRDPERYGEMHRRVWRHVKRRVRETTGRARQRAFFDKLYLHRSHPVAGIYHDFASLGTVYAEPAAERDHETIVEVARRHEGDESAAIAAHWLRRQPGAFRVYREANGGVLGVVATLAAHEASPADLAIDPAIRAAADFARARAPLRPGDETQYVRFHMERDLYQRLSPVTNLLATTVSLAPLDLPRLAWTFLAFAEPDRWEPIMSYIDFSRAEDAAFIVGGRRYGVFAHDWRAAPFDTWWDMEAERSLGVEPEPAPTEVRPAASLVVLSEPDFGAAVRQALRDYPRPRALATNPLMRSRLVIEVAGGEPTPATLQALVREAAERLKASPRGEKFYRAILHTYLQPAPSQERAAERLGLSFSTYRYHLSRGTERVIEGLWERELNGAGPLAT
jgi:hypothetical protein